LLIALRVRRIGGSLHAAYSASLLNHWQMPLAFSTLYTSISSALLIAAATQQHAYAKTKSPAGWFNAISVTLGTMVGVFT
jgi:hypothetical protein